MKFAVSRALFAVALSLAAFLSLGPSLHAQALNPPSQQNEPTQLQAYALGDGTWTHFNEGRNLGLTGGLSYHRKLFPRFQPTLDVRYTYAMDKGTVAGLSSFAGGPGFSMRFRNFHPYGYFFLGTGTIKFVHPAGTYKQDGSTILQFGGGTDYLVPKHPRWAICVEASEQRWKLDTAGAQLFTPVSISMGVRYRWVKHNPY